MPELPRAALVTGAARRIGRGIALALAALGFDLAVHHHRSRREAQALVEEIRARGRRAVAVEGDLEREEAPGAILERAQEALGPIGLLVNNAALFLDDPPQELSGAVWARQMAVNLRAPIALSLAFAGRLPPKSEGLIVNVLDSRILDPTPNYLSYTVSKAGLWAATQVLARRFAPRVRVVALALGLVLPGPRERRETFDRLVARTPLGRPVALGEIEAALRFCVEARSLTGVLLPLDGGRHMGALASPGTQNPTRKA